MAGYPIPKFNQKIHPYLSCSLTNKLGSQNYPHQYATEAKLKAMPSQSEMPPPDEQIKTDNLNSQ